LHILTSKKHELARGFKSGRPPPTGAPYQQAPKDADA
jgi:hypothetical protein